MSILVSGFKTWQNLRSCKSIHESLLSSPFRIRFEPSHLKWGFSIAHTGNACVFLFDSRPALPVYRFLFGFYFPFLSKSFPPHGEQFAYCDTGILLIILHRKYWSNQSSASSKEKQNVPNTTRLSWLSHSSDFFAQLSMEKEEKKILQTFQNTKKKQLPIPLT